MPTGSPLIELDQRKIPNHDGLFAELGVFEFHADRDAVVSVDCEQAGNGVVIVDAVQFLKVGSPDDSQDSKADQAARQQLRKQKNDLETTLAAHKKKKPEAQVAMAVEDGEPADWHIHIRGGIRNLGPLTPRRALSVACEVDPAGASKHPMIPKAESGRRQLADWLASERNPLTARVYVNRVWHYVLGEGIVRTPDNFGSMGQRPTHPELLDYLTAKFVSEDGWSTKALIRRIVTSRIYRIRSGTNPDDPDNRFLTRAFRRRLEAEALRDAILSVTGELKLESAGGRTIRRLTQYDNGYDHGDISGGVRSVYVPFFRNSMLEFFTVFDVANPNLVTGKRTVSTLPSQSLYLLNSPFVLKRAEKAAEFFLAAQTSNSGDSASDDNVMIQEACLRTLGRRPDSLELRILASQLQRGADRDAWAAVFQALFASLDFRYLD